MENILEAIKQSEAKKVARRFYIPAPKIEKVLTEILSIETSSNQTWVNFVLSKKNQQALEVKENDVFFILVAKQLFKDEIELERYSHAISPSFTLMKLKATSEHITSKGQKFTLNKSKLLDAGFVKVNASQEELISTLENESKSKSRTLTLSNCLRLLIKNLGPEVSKAKIRIQLDAYLNKVTISPNLTAQPSGSKKSL